MKSLLYLLRKTAKNRLLQMKRKPALIIVYLLFFALIGVSLVSAASMPASPRTEASDIGWLKLIFLGYLLLFAFSSVSAGLSNGASIFEMPDVNFLFVSPVNPKQILAYGLMSQAVKSILSSVFILMMGATLKRTWGIGIKGLLCLFVGYVVALIVFQLVSVVIYMFASARPALKKIMVAVCLLLVIPTLVAVAVPYLQGQTLPQAIMGAMNGPVLLTLPIAGWIAEGAFALLGGNLAYAALAFGLVLLGVGAALVLLTAGKSDYYEDVLVATETTFQRKRAAAEGNLNAMDAKRKVKVNSDGRGGIWGKGASVFFGKHMLEIFRKNRLKLLDATSFSFLITTVIMSFSLRSVDSIIFVMATTMFMRSLMIGTGLGLRELYSHYIFMVPESSFSKIVWSNLEIAAKGLVENILMFTVAGVIVKASPLEVVGCIITTSLFVGVLISINLLSMRIFSNVISQGLLMTLYILFVVLVMVPGIVAAVICGVVLGGLLGTLAAMGALCLWQLGLSALFFFLARGVLDSCDMETMSRPVR